MLKKWQNGEFHVKNLLYHNKINLWDIAAGKIIIEEAGGKVNDIFSFKENKIDIRAASSNIFDKMLENIAKF